MKRRRRLLVCISNQNDGKSKSQSFAPILSAQAVVVSFAPILLTLAVVVMSVVGRSWMEENFMRMRKLFNYEIEDVTRIFYTMTVLFLGGSLVLINQSNKSASETVAALTVYPGLGAQLSTETTYQNIMDRVQVKHLCFLPRDQIFDCVVYEVVQSHKVMSVVAIRILRPPNPTSKENTSMKDLQLIPVFPGTEMTYEECLYMRREIMNALELVEG